jgi:hypothetical protein
MHDPVAPSRKRSDHRAATVHHRRRLFAAVTLGYLYAVEAAATGGMALLLFALAGRTLTLDRFKEALNDPMAITGALFALLVGATVFTLIVARVRYRSIGGLAVRAGLRRRNLRAVADRPC